jgi:hypothetical protein
MRCGRLKRRKKRPHETARKESGRVSNISELNTRPVPFCNDPLCNVVIDDELMHARGGMDIASHMLP